MGKQQGSVYRPSMGFLGGPGVKNSPTSAGDARDVDSIPGSGRSPEGRMATQSRILAWKSHGQRSLVGYSPRGSQRVRHNWARAHTHSLYGTGNYIQHPLISLNETEKKKFVLGKRKSIWGLDFISTCTRVDHPQPSCKEEHFNENTSS